MSLKQKDALLDAYDIQCAISSDSSLKLLLAVRQTGPADGFFLPESSSSESDSDSSGPTKPVSRPPRKKASQHGLVAESAVAATPADRTAAGEAAPEPTEAPLGLKTSLELEERSKASPAVSSSSVNQDNLEQPAAQLPRTSSSKDQSTSQAGF
eukprot:m.257608 g.257608  ORF g.257608 m.257608 type:complete len:154 (+) comp54567_c0_seq47:153-614(+)